MALAEMTSVLYSAGLNYQSSNPVRQEIVAVRREVTLLRKEVETLAEENLVYRKHLMKLVASLENGQAEFTKDLQMVAMPDQVNSVQREAGGGTVQGAGFRR
jgi:hypothetical protein